MFSFSGWLTIHLEEYHQTLRAMCREFHNRKHRLKQPDSSLADLRGFNDLCLSMADKCQQQGDDGRSLSILLSLHQQLVSGMADEAQDMLFRLQALQLARYSLSQLSHRLMQEGEWEQVCHLQEEFFCYSEQLP
ncbi:MULTISPECIES: hypothetical protein [Tatumella]|uniref:Uncharacterized protein n=1 Tax=Tatumella punctata TaxID=399969 RepID=A0ABW1VM92_9GAMM|nr:MULTISPECIES: hypothetical protein [unclassified Tatumella]MBS0855025.1 hypothetical protein [Tatumella sp. JGM16]MBS0876056.1 hypothetical protein [Tatumella sp. JGM82]MBS0890530.1 hypothetical protein [Tatumella sp. JGM94]MBS0892641.1 hypothetical protein [Tatumella sp. JGM130]MBS0900986.1 hypothetical protein [Tatumella sp. JGM100]